MGKFCDAVVGELTRAANTLPLAGRIAFEACCAERLAPLYHDFHRQAKWGSPETLREAIVWSGKRSPAK